MSRKVLTKIKKCSCVDIDIGSYDNQLPLSTVSTSMSDYKNIVCVDVCLAKEVHNLWEKGIITLGCCCGHGKTHGYIQTTPEMEESMIQMGYIRFENKLNPIDPCFYPRTLVGDT